MPDKLHNNKIRGLSSPSHQRGKLLMFFPIILLFFIFAFTPSPINAQPNTSTNNSLILSDAFNGHYLSPYIFKISDPGEQFSPGNIVYQHINREDATTGKGSIATFGSTGGSTWISFDLVNRSSSNYWQLDFGKTAMGRFGLFKKLNVYVSNASGNKIVKIKTSDVSVSPLPIPINEKSIVILRLTQDAGQPATIPLRIINETEFIKTANKEKNNLHLLIMGFVGMIFLLIGIFILRPNKSNLLLAFYYLFGVAFIVIQNNYIIFEVPILGTNILSALLLIASIFGLLSAYFFWNMLNDTKIIKAIILGLIIISVLIYALLSFSDIFSSNMRTCLFFGTTFLILTIITLFSFIQTHNGNIESPFYFIAWLIFLAGNIVTALAISSIIPVIPLTINAALYALVPQAILFILAIKTRLYNASDDISFSKNLSIKDTENVSRLRQTKENAEQDRLVRVIEQERKVLGELRKSEARRAEEMQRAKEEADEANRGKSAFLAVVSHEIRTPMTGVMGMVKLLLQTKLSKEQKDCALTIQDSGEAMLSLLNDILDFEKIERGKMDFENINMDIHRLINGVSTLMSGHATQKGIELKTKVGKNLPQFVKCDPTRLRQILLNLTGNSIKFTQEGHVTLTVELIKEHKKCDSQTQYEIYFGISDSGIGISSEAQKNLFEAFSQADSSISRKFGGTGLGLAISKGLVEGMGSEINLSSKDGEGSTFFFTMTMDRGDGNASKIEMDEPEVVPQVMPISILVVDDNEINRKVIIGFLNTARHKIEISDNAEDALTRINEDHFDLVLMDIQLPGMNGDEATKVIRKSQDPRIANLPVIALTGNTMDDDVAQYYIAGMNEVLAKPIDADKLNEIVKKISDHKSIGDNNYSKSIIEPERVVQTGAPTKSVTQNKNTQDDPQALTKNIEEPTKKIETIKPIKPRKSMPSLVQEKQDLEDELQQQEPPQTNNTVPQEATEDLPSKAILKTKPSLDLEKDDDTTPISQYISSLHSSHGNGKSVFEKSNIEALKIHLGKEELKEMLQDTITKSEEIINELINHYNENSHDLATISGHAHDLKGMTGNFGLTELSYQASLIEQDVKDKEGSDLARLISSLPEMQTRAKEALAQWVNG